MHEAVVVEDELVSGYAIVGLRGNDAEVDAGQRHDGEEPVELAGHHTVVADCGVERLLGDEEVKPVVAAVEDLLAFHAGGDSGIEIVGDLVEVDDAAHDGGGVLNRVENPWHEDGLVPAHHSGACFDLLGGPLPACGSRAEHATPFDIHGFDVAHGGDQV